MLILKAPAKINLAIDVLNKRDDGYHNIDIVTIPLELHDSLELETYPKKYGTFVTSDDSSLICDESNLVYISYRLMKSTFHLEPGLRIKIFKRIPMEAGLGGGSADAASVINAINKIHKLNLTDQQKIDLAIQVGSDVPYCLFNKPARIEKKGEKLTFLNLKKNYYVLLIQPNMGLSTAGVYKLYDKVGGDKPNIDKLIQGLETNNDKLIEDNMVNALQKAATIALPEIGNIINKLKDAGLKKVMMSGSGSTVFALDEDKEKIKNIAKLFNDDNHSVWVTKTACKINK